MREQLTALVVINTIVFLKDILIVLFTIWQICQPLPTLNEIRAYVQQGICSIRPDIKRELNPTPYKVVLII